jgi:hypothetical protein
MRESRAQLYVWTDLGQNQYLLAEIIWGMYCAAVVESVASKPAPFKKKL